MLDKLKAKSMCQTTQQKRITQTVRHPNEEDKVESKLADVVDTQTVHWTYHFHIVMMMMIMILLTSVLSVM